MSAAVSPIIAFFDRSGTDHRGRSIDAVLAFPDRDLEDEHDFIQWLFPLFTRSQFNATAPVLTDADAAEFKARPELGATLRQALDRMLRFYGFALETSPDGPHVVRAEDWPQKTRRWLTPSNHNFLRITRILHSCLVLGLAAESRAFHQALDQLGGSDEARIIGARTFEFWRNAVET